MQAHLDIVGATEEDRKRFIKATVIHELGHQFGLDDHPADQEPPKTRNGKWCVMYDSQPSALIDLEFAMGAWHKSVIRGGNFDLWRCVT